MKFAPLGFFLAALGCGTLSAPSVAEAPASGDVVPAPAGPVETDSGLLADRDAAATLISLLDERKLQGPSRQDFAENAVLGDVTKLATPAGFRLSNRVLRLGVPLAQALAFSRDRQVLNRLQEAARWTGNVRVRSEALVALASLKKPEHFKFFREAALDPNPAIQFAALESLQVWGGTQAVALALQLSDERWSPLIRVYATQAALRLGEPSAREKLVQLLKTDRSWLVRAMAAKYLGEMGRPEDADLLLSRIGPEQDNKFVLAEVCLAAINLTAKRAPPPPPKPAPRPRKGVPEAPRRDVFELEPLVVRAPRARLFQPVDVRIDNDLVRLLSRLASDPEETEKIVDTALDDLRRLETPTGIALKTRYFDLTYLLIEGLAGTRDLGLQQKLEEFARTARDARVRAVALISLGHDRQRWDIGIFRDALRDPNVLVRFGAVEALAELGQTSSIGSLADAANSDSSPVVRVFAAQAMARLGDAQGRDLLRRFTDDQNWVIRAAATYYLGEHGEPDDYHRIKFKMNSETNPFPLAEACLALYRLSPA
jgi:HEAT repeat protein